MSKEGARRARATLRAQIDAWARFGANDFHVDKKKRAVLSLVRFLGVSHKRRRKLASAKRIDCRFAVCHRSALARRGLQARVLLVLSHVLAAVRRPPYLWPKRTRPGTSVPSIS